MARRDTADAEAIRQVGLRRQRGTDLPFADLDFVSQRVVYREIEWLTGLGLALPNGFSFLPRDLHRVYPMRPLEAAPVDVKR